VRQHGNDIYTIKTRSVGDASCKVVGGGCGWLRVVDTRLAAATLSGTGARVYIAHRGGWLGVVTGISAASTGGVLVLISKPSPIDNG